MLTLIVGQRGTGKTTFVDRLCRDSGHGGEAVVGFDLDREIERQSAVSISTLFASIGEDAFRRLEEKTLFELVSRSRSMESPVVVVLGAGYSGQLPEGSRVVWLQRITDAAGRIFIDRPRLDPHLAPLEEFHGRANKREQRFRGWADDILLLQEGCVARDDSVQSTKLVPPSPESIFLGLHSARMGGCLTVVPGEYRIDEIGVANRLSWGIDRLELRDDLLTEPQIQTLCDAVPHRRLLLSFRARRASRVMEAHRHRCDWDWPVELGDCPWGSPPIASMHDRLENETLVDAAARLVRVASSISGSHCKLAVEVCSLEELMDGHRWWAQSPESRSFLPRSSDGRWAWYRLRQKGFMKINFLRTATGSSPDQPGFMEWARAPARARHFAAVLGDPVEHSRTPSEHHRFFADKSMPVVSLRLSERELTRNTMDNLAELGLTHAAVTAPLKNKMAELSVADRLELRSVNTVVVDEGDWRSTNTDVGALSRWLTHLADRSVVLWGGGGTRQAVLQVLPNAVAYSARRGAPLVAAEVAEPEVVIWAVGRNRQDDCCWPPTSWKPELVCDLNYSDDSPGREYALRLGCRYESGMRMFELQAQAQRDYWSQGFAPASKGREHVSE